MLLGLQYFTYAVSMDCTNMIILANGMNLAAVQPSIMTLLTTNCCTATGVTCTGQNVTAISWRGYRMNGYLNFTAVPSGVSNLNLDGNWLTGTLPQLPEIMTIFSAGDNRLSGTLPSTWPV